MESYGNKPIINIIGIGASGYHALVYMQKSFLSDVNYFFIDDDKERLASITQGTPILVNGMIDLGECEILLDADLSFIVTELGSHFNSQTAIDIASNNNGLNIGLMMTPVMYKDNKQILHVKRSYYNVSKNVDSLILLSNNKLQKIIGSSLAHNDYSLVNNFISDIVQNIANLITKQGIIGIDFADIRTVLVDQSCAEVGIGIATGNQRAFYATMSAIKDSLIDELDLFKATSVLICNGQ